MKKILILLTFMLTSIYGKAQVVIDSINGKIYVDRVQEIDLSKDELKNKAERWVAKAYNNSNYVTRINNDDNILTKGSFEVGAEFKSYGTTIYSVKKVEYTLDLKFKDGRYKIEIANLLIDDIEHTTALLVYFMSLEQYREFYLNVFEDYDGFGKKAIIKRVNNDKKFKKIYDSQQDYGNEIIPQIVNKLKQIDSSLLTFLKSEDDEGDW